MTKTVSEIDAEIKQLEKLREEALEAETLHERQQAFDEAVILIGNVQEAVERLIELDYLPSKLQQRLADEDGKVKIKMLCRAPRKVK